MDIDIQEVCIGKFTGTNDEVRGMFRRAVLSDLQAHYEPNQVIITFHSKQDALDWIAPYSYGANPATYLTAVSIDTLAVRSGRFQSKEPNQSNTPKHAPQPYPFKSRPIEPKRSDSPKSTMSAPYGSNSSLANQIHDIESGNVIER